MTKESSLNINLCGLVPLTNQYKNQAHVAKQILNIMDGNKDEQDVFVFNCTSIDPLFLVPIKGKDIEKIKVENGEIQMCSCKMVKFKESTTPLFECKCLVPNKNNTLFDKGVHNFRNILNNSNTPNIVKRECTFVESVSTPRFPGQFMCIPKIERKELFQQKVEKVIEQTMKNYPNIKKSEATDLAYKSVVNNILNSNGGHLLNQNTNVFQRKENSTTIDISENSASKQRKPTRQSKETLQVNLENPILPYLQALVKTSVESSMPKIPTSQLQNHKELVKEETNEEIKKYVPTKVLSKLDRKKISPLNGKLKRARRSVNSSTTSTTLNTSSTATALSTMNITTNITGNTTGNATRSTSLTVTPTLTISSFTTKPINETDVETINVLIPISVGMFLLVLFILLMKSLTKNRRWKD